MLKEVGQALRGFIKIVKRKLREKRGFLSLKNTMQEHR